MIRPARRLRQAEVVFGRASTARLESRPRRRALLEHDVRERRRSPAGGNGNVARVNLLESSRAPACLRVPILPESVCHLRPFACCADAERRLGSVPHHPAVAAGHGARSSACGRRAAVDKGVAYAALTDPHEALRRCKACRRSSVGMMKSPSASAISVFARDRMRELGDDLSPAGLRSVRASSSELHVCSGVGRRYRTL